VDRLRELANKVVEEYNELYDVDYDQDGAFFCGKPVDQILEQYADELTDNEYIELESLVYDKLEPSY